MSKAAVCRNFSVKRTTLIETLARVGMILSLREAVTGDREPQSLMAQVTALTGTTLSVGFVLWAVRKGKLLAGCCATIPTLSAEEPGRRQRLRPRL